MGGDRRLEKNKSVLFYLFLPALLFFVLTMGRGLDKGEGIAKYGKCGRITVFNYVMGHVDDVHGCIANAEFACLASYFDCLDSYSNFYHVLLERDTRNEASNDRTK